MKIYSFKDLVGSINHPLAGIFPFTGQKGMGQITVAMATEKTTHDVAADGTVMASYISGDNGIVTIEVQQTSELHAFLLQAYNLAKVNADSGDVSLWAAGVLFLRNMRDGSSHLGRGISFSKIADKVYAAQGQKITWTLMVADLQNLTA